MTKGFIFFLVNGKLLTDSVSEGNALVLSELRDVSSGVKFDVTVHSGKPDDVNLGFSTCPYAASGQCLYEGNMYASLQ